MRDAAAVLATARAAVLPEGGLHHVCAAVGTSAVVIYGGYISPQVTGYEGQTAFFTGSGLGCGMRVACTHCKQSMEAIAPEAVFEALQRALNA
jgi:ADP-heptose:LPS heptosyltransferase